MATKTSVRPEVDMLDVRGLASIKRALEIAAVGNHSVLLMGVPGVGKTMLARRLPTILPEWSEEEARETAKLYSIAGLPAPSSRPFQSPHHTISNTGMFGTIEGTRGPQRPGAVSLAHQGVLYLDELHEFPFKTLAALDYVRDEGASLASPPWPARWVLIGSTIPCLCGFRGSEVRTCACTPAQVSRYQRRLSKLTTPFDIRVTMPPKSAWMSDPACADESSATIRARVTAARAFAKRQHHDRDVYRHAVRRLPWVARSIAALAHSEVVTDAHLAEAEMLTRRIEEL